MFVFRRNTNIGQSEVGKLLDDGVAEGVKEKDDPVEALSQVLDDEFAEGEGGGTCQYDGSHGCVGVIDDSIVRFLRLIQNIGDDEVLCAVTDSQGDGVANGGWMSKNPQSWA